MPKDILVVLDFDNTLVRSKNSLEEACRIYASACGIPGGLPVHEIWTELSIPSGSGSARSTFPVKDLSALADWVFSDPLYHLQLLPGVGAALKRMARSGRVRMAILSSKPDGLISGALRSLEERGELSLEYFSAIWGKTSVERHGFEDKPHPGALQELIRQEGFRPEDCIVVGDTLIDMIVAGYIGADAIGINPDPAAREGMLGAGALTVLESFSALPGFLETREGAKPVHGTEPAFTLGMPGVRRKVKFRGERKFLIAGADFPPDWDPSRVKIGIGSEEESGHSIRMDVRLAWRGGEALLEGWYMDFTFQGIGKSEGVEFSLHSAFNQFLSIVWWPE